MVPRETTLFDLHDHNHQSVLVWVIDLLNRVASHVGPMHHDAPIDYFDRHNHADHRNEHRIRIRHAVVLVDHGDHSLILHLE